MSVNPIVYILSCVQSAIVPASTEPVFVNVFGAREPISRNRFRQPTKPGGPVLQIGLSYRPVSLGIDSWAP